MSAPVTRPTRLVPDLVLIGDRFERGRVVTLADGRIGEIVPVLAGDGADATHLPGKALLPGTVNTHCHTFQSLLRGLGDDLDFMGWRDGVLYPYSTRLDREGARVEAVDRPRTWPVVLTELARMVSPQPDSGRRP